MGHIIFLVTLMFADRRNARKENMNVVRRSAFLSEKSELIGIVRKRRENC